MTTGPSESCRRSICHTSPSVYDVFVVEGVVGAKWCPVCGTLYRRQGESYAPCRPTWSPLPTALGTEIDLAAYTSTLSIDQIIAVDRYLESQVGLPTAAELDRWAEGPRAYRNYPWEPDPKRYPQPGDVLQKGKYVRKVVEIVELVREPRTVLEVLVMTEWGDHIPPSWRASSTGVNLDSWRDWSKRAAVIAYGLPWAAYWTGESPGS